MIKYQLFSFSGSQFTFSKISAVCLHFLKVTAVCLQQDELDTNECNVTVTEPKKTFLPLLHFTAVSTERLEGELLREVGPVGLLHKAFSSESGLAWESHVNTAPVR